MRETETLAGDFLRKVKDRSLIVGIMGLGYVGLPLMLACSAAGFRVLGFDINSQHAEALNAGRSPLDHISGSAIADARRGGLFEATCDMGRLGEPDAILICVPTPLGKHLEPDLSFVAATTSAIAARLRPGQLVVLESTTYPGTTGELCRPALEKTGLKSGTDFFLAFSPEREDPGNAEYSTSTIPKVVGADGAVALELACAFYSSWAQRIVPVSSLETAEAVKITENVFRAVNIALVNELKMIYSAMGIDIFEVIDAAKTKPFGFMPFYPGPGLGGHCIPIDPYYLTWRARSFGINTRFIELAGAINGQMPQYVIDRLAEALDQRSGIALSRAKILLIGVAYKKNVSDTRESPGLVILERLLARGTTVDFHDPHVAEIPLTREHAGLAGRRSVTLDSIAGYDAVLVVTNHDRVDWKLIAAQARLVVDTRHAVGHGGNVVRA